MHQLFSSDKVLLKEVTALINSVPNAINGRVIREDKDRDRGNST